MESKMLVSYDFSGEDEACLVVAVPTVDNTLIVVNEFYGNNATEVWDLLSGSYLVDENIS